MRSPMRWCEYQSVFSIGKHTVGQGKREKRVTVSNTEGSWKFKKYFDIKHRDVDFGICPSGFLSCFCLTFPHLLLFLPFEMVMHIPCHYILQVYDLIFNFYFIGDYS